MAAPLGASLYTNKGIEKEMSKTRREGRSPAPTCQGTFNGCSEWKQTGNLLDLVELDKLHMMSFLPISYFLSSPAVFADTVYISWGCCSFV